MDSSRSSVKDGKNTDRQQQRNRGGGRGPVWCSHPKPTSHSDANCRARRRKQADGNACIVSSGSWRKRGICSAFDLPEVGQSAGTPLHLLDKEVGGTSYGGNFSGAKPQ